MNKTKKIVPPKSIIPNVLFHKQEQDIKFYATVVY